MQVAYSSTSPISVKISLGIDPWHRYKAGWGDGYRETFLPGKLVWSLDPDMQISIKTTGEITANAFNASRTILSNPEDPNFDYPVGHFIPFPLMLVEVNGRDHFTIDIEVK